MVKTPPCSKYEPPRNIEYTRNGKTFCRISKKGEVNGPQIPPCEQYGKEYILYEKNKKQFCRKSTKKKTQKKQKKTVCNKQNHQKLKTFANILNINLKDYNDKEWICQQMKQIFNETEPDLKDVKYLSTILKISTKNKTNKILCQEIINKIVKKKEFNEIIDIIKDGKQLNNNIVINILLSTLYPNKFPRISPLQITKELYNELIDKHKHNKPLNEHEKTILDISLYIKLSHCTKKMILKSKLLKDIFDKDEDINPYALCTNSVYTQRGIKPPAKIVRAVSFTDLKPLMTLNNSGDIGASSREAVLRSVKEDSKALSLASPELKKDRGVVLAAVTQDGMTLQYASVELKNDKDVLLAAVMQDGLALQYASVALQHDESVVLAAVKQTGLALKFASADLQNDEYVALAAVTQNVGALQYASERLQDLRTEYGF